MPPVRLLWYGVGVVGALAAVAVFVGAVFGSAGVTVESVAVQGETPTNTSANCAGSVVRNVDVSVTLSRPGVGAENPQWWDVGLAVRASVFESAKQRTVTLAPGAERTVTIPFTSVREKSWAPRQHVEAVVQVTKGNSEIARRTSSVALVAVEAGRDC